MKTMHELNEDITNLTVKINSNYPELSKYINEMTISIPYLKDPKIDTKNLLDYYNSLSVFLQKYALEHDGI
jgi:hypothetical protein